MAAKNPNKRGAQILIVSILLGIMGLFAYAASKFTPGKFIVILTGLGLIGFLATHWSLVGVNPSPIFKPLAGIMKPYFDSISLAPGIQALMLCLIGTEENDETRTLFPE